MISIGRVCSAVLLALALALSGAGAEVHRCLPADKAVPQDALVRSIVAQEQLRINVPQSSSGSGGAVGLGGLLAALVVKAVVESNNRSRNERAQALLAPLLKSTADLSLREPLWRELRAAVPASSWLRATSFDTTAVTKTTTVEELKDRGQLCLETYYWLSENGVILMVQTLAKYWLRGEPQPAYFGRS